MTLNQPKVSIITPTLNSGRFIKDNIKSILTQIYPNIEHIIIDGGSTDNTLSVIKEFDPDAKVLTEPDEGISDAFNKGIRMATGDIIVMLNSDDCYADEYVIQKVVDIFLDHPDVKAVYGKVKCINPETGETLMSFGKPFSSKKTKILASIAHPALFVKREVYDTIGYYALEYKCAMDHDFFLRITKLYEPKFINEVLTIMRFGGFSTMNMFKGHRETYKILRATGMNFVSASLDLFYRYTMTFISLALQKIGLDSLVLFYRRKKGRL